MGEFIEENFCSASARTEKEILSGLSEPQKEAVKSIDGPLLIIAGAGSGKTMTITHRIAYMIGVRGISPSNILAITFTNKAAKVMSDRALGLIGETKEKPFISTFHSFGAHELRKYASVLGYDSHFGICDDQESKKVMKGILQEIDDEHEGEDTWCPVAGNAGEVLSGIEKAKRALLSPEDLNTPRGEKFMLANISGSAKLFLQEYREYQKELIRNNLMDFADLITNLVYVFMKSPESLRKCQEQYKYICVDEYQDTDNAQFTLVRMIADRYRNICVVGDDDQSIYGFRGADVSNILHFKEQYPDAKQVTLAENYRSAGNIIEAAADLIEENGQRIPKRMFTSKAPGAPVSIIECETGDDEAEAAADVISKQEKEGTDLREIAVLYRTNAQSRAFEETLLMRGIPYHLVGGVAFYQRAEIKDLCAYLRILVNPDDAVSLKRILNVPARGIGKSTIAEAERNAKASGESFGDALRGIGSRDTKAGKAVNKFFDLCGELKKDAEKKSVSDLILSILEKTGYGKALRKKDGTDGVSTRFDNAMELCTKAAIFEEGRPEESGIVRLQNFLEEAALFTDADKNTDPKGVALMTIHASKGMEFDTVILAGMEDNLLPHKNCETAKEIEEERRLAYVGITRAKKNLFLTYAHERIMYGKPVRNMRSSFFCDLPTEKMKFFRYKSGKSVAENKKMPA